MPMNWSPNIAHYVGLVWWIEVRAFDVVFAISFAHNPQITSGKLLMGDVFLLQLMLMISNAVDIVW